MATYLTAPPPQPADTASPRTFSDFAERRMWSLLKSYDSQVGSKYEGTGAEGKSKTDCITYVMQVIAGAFEDTGAKDIADEVRARSKKGTELARYLTGRGWKAYYWNPDVKNPRDHAPEHPFAYHTAIKTNSYYTVPISGLIIDYNLSPVPNGIIDRILGRTHPSQKSNQMGAFNALSKVKFGYGLARGGDHTFLLSYGMIFEVHWDKIGLSLYQRSSLYTFPWLDGLFTLPPDSGFSS